MLYIKDVAKDDAQILREVPEETRPKPPCWSRLGGHVSVRKGRRNISYHYDARRHVLVIVDHGATKGMHWTSFKIATRGEADVAIDILEGLL